MKKFKIIVAYNKNNVIGNEGNLIYRIPNDLANFKRMTSGGVVVMGRKTFESIGSPLPDRINIIITSNKDYNVDVSDNVIIVHSLESAMELCDAFYSDKEWYVIGGGSVYDEVLNKDVVDTIYATVISDEKDGDTKFRFQQNCWRRFYESAAQESKAAGVYYKFVIYKKV